MLIDLSEFLSVKDKVESVNVNIEMKAFALAGEQYQISDNSPFVLLISNQGTKKVTIEGKTRLSLMIPCSRCLEDVKYNFEFDIMKFLDLSKSEEDRIQELDETGYIEGTVLDVDKLIHSEILIEFPMKVLCNNDCKGICNQCGANLNTKVCNCDRVVSDPRMAAIQDIFKNFKGV